MTATNTDRLLRKSRLVQQCKHRLERVTRNSPRINIQPEGRKASKNTTKKQNTPKLARRSRKNSRRKSYFVQILPEINFTITHLAPGRKKKKTIKKGISPTALTALLFPISSTTRSWEEEQSGKKRVVICLVPEPDFFHSFPTFQSPFGPKIAGWAVCCGAQQENSGTIQQISSLVS